MPICRMPRLLAARSDSCAYAGWWNDASNTDPYASKPTTTNHWVKTGPHVMILGADASFYDTYPKSADPDTSSPSSCGRGRPIST